MQSINVGNKRLIAVTVPPEVTMYNIAPLKRSLFYWNASNASIHILDLEFDYKIIGLEKSISEEQWAGIVQAPDWFLMEWYYMNYVEEEFNCQTATESGLSLLQKHGVDPENTLIIEII